MARFTVRGSRELQAALRAAGPRAEQGLRAGIHVEAEQIMAASKQEAPVGTDGVLRASGFVEAPKKVGNRVGTVFGYGGAAKGYALFVHEGTGPAAGRAPFFPPPAAFVQWVRKFIGASAKQAGTEADPGPTAWLVARAVGRRGLAPTKFLERPLKARSSGMGDRVAARVRRSLEGR